MASHLGSGAAVSVACARAVAAHVGVELSAAEASALAYEIEKLHHGTPSGIDNTVIAYEQPVWFVRGEPVELLHFVLDDRRQTTDDQAMKRRPSPAACRLIVADTGTSTPTKIPVAHVRQCWERDKTGHERLFDDIAGLVHTARHALEASDWPALGNAMNCRITPCCRSSACHLIN